MLSTVTFRGLHESLTGERPPRLQAETSIACVLQVLSLECSLCGYKATCRTNAEVQDALHQVHNVMVTGLACSSLCSSQLLATGPASLDRILSSQQARAKRLLAEVILHMAQAILRDPRLQESGDVHKWARQLVCAEVSFPAAGPYPGKLIARP